MRDRYDVVVVGSGFGGAITAARLAQAGRSVCVLERGRRWDKREFPRALAEVKGGVWRDGESYGFIDYRVFNRMDVVQGVGVGGGSLHYFNVKLRAPEEILRRPEWPAAIKRPLLDRYYALTSDVLESKPLVPPSGYAMPRRTEAFREAAARAGRSAELVPIAVYTGEPRKNPYSGIEQEPCDYTGGCLFGCRVRAKNTLDLNYIPWAESKFGMEVRPLHAAEKIEPIEGGGYRVHFKKYDPADPTSFEWGSVAAEKVVVAAGTLGSAELLLRSRDQYRTLPNLPAMLGRRFSGNGDMLFAGALETAQAVNPGQGPSITAGVDMSRPGSKHRIYVEDLGFPDPFMWLLEGTLPSSSRTWGLLRAAGSYVSAALRLGRRDASRIAFEGDQLFAGTRTQHFLPYLGMGTDAADGVLKLDKDGALDLDWNPAASMPMYAEMEEALRALAGGAGGRYLTSFLWQWPLRRLLTAHPLGGCVMSDRADAGVVNDRGEVWGHQGLFVADGSIIPGALSVNPSLTISALAERIAYVMVNGKDLDAAAREPLNPATATG